MVRLCMFMQNISVDERWPWQVEAPPLFPPTFLYNSSWEDPEKDMAALNVGPGDACLTLTSGGCNALNLCLQVPALPGLSILRLAEVLPAMPNACVCIDAAGSRHANNGLRAQAALQLGARRRQRCLCCSQGADYVTAVDCNPAQSALLELKATAIRCCSAARGAPCFEFDLQMLCS